MNPGDDDTQTAHQTTGERRTASDDLKGRQDDDVTAARVKAICNISRKTAECLGAPEGVHADWLEAEAKLFGERKREIIALIETIEADAKYEESVEQAIALCMAANDVTEVKQLLQSIRSEQARECWRASRRSTGVSGRPGLRRATIELELKLPHFPYCEANSPFNVKQRKVTRFSQAPRTSTRRIENQLALTVRRQENQSSVRRAPVDVIGQPRQSRTDARRMRELLYADPELAVPHIAPPMSANYSPEVLILSVIN